MWVPMHKPFFKTRPIEDEAQLYGRSRELTELKQTIKAGFWPVLVGSKRVGKTSLMKVLVRWWGGIYVDASSCITAKDLKNKIIEEIESNKIVVDKAEVDFKVVRAEFKKNPAMSLEQLMKRLGNRAVAIDEIQNVNDPTLPKLFSTIYNETHVILMFSGSTKGLIKQLLNDPVMLGRPTERKVIYPFDPETAANFLREGFSKDKIAVNPNEINDAVSRLGGTPGWLAYYGAKRFVGLDHETAVAQVEQHAKDVLRQELKEFGSLQQAIIRSMAALGPQPTWSDVKTLTERRYGKKVKDFAFNNSLKNLEALNVLKHTGKHYELVDPLYKLA
jgi:AAA+ ATPase superfamily predicted ATPase